MSIRATQDDYVAWVMTPNRARKVARVLRWYTGATNEAARLEAAATEAEQRDATQ